MHTSNPNESKARTIFRVVSGNFLEMYDFMVYGYYAKAIADTFFPAGNDTGEASFGDQQGTLVAVDDGGYAVVVGRAETPSWLAVATGLDEAAFRQIASDFVRLD